MYPSDKDTEQSFQLLKGSSILVDTLLDSPLRVNNYCMSHLSQMGHNRNQVSIQNIQTELFDLDMLLVGKQLDGMNQEGNGVLQGKQTLMVWKYFDLQDNNIP